MHFSNSVKLWVLVKAEKSIFIHIASNQTIKWLDTYNLLLYSKFSHHLEEGIE